MFLVVTRQPALAEAGGCVAIGVPAPRALAVMTGGGLRVPRGWVAEQARRRARDGIPEAAAVRFARALAFGGLTEAEALDALADLIARPFGGGLELWRAWRGPADRWFRDAWRRAAGGPIWIDLATARDIQARRILAAARRHNVAAGREDHVARLAGRPTNGPATVELDDRAIARALAAAPTPAAIAGVWPADLPRNRRIMP